MRYKSDFFISGLFFLILIVGSFAPAVNVILLYLNGGLLSLFEDLSGQKIGDFFSHINLAFAITFLIGYFLSKQIISRWITAIFFVFFLNAFVFFGFEDRFENSNYWTTPLIIALISGIALIFVDIIKVLRK